MRSVFLLLIALGLSISGYLLYRHFALSDPSGEVGGDFCSAVFGTGCDEALQSPLAVQFGLPLAGWGLVYYGTVAALLLLGWTIGETLRFEATTAALLLALTAAVGSIALLVVMATGLSPFCPLCAVVHAINLLLVFVLKPLSASPVGRLVGAVVQAIRYLVGGKAADPVAARWRMVGFLAAGLVAVVIYQWVFVEAALRAQSAQDPFDPLQTIALFESGMHHDIPIGEEDPRLGPPDAAVRMVVFSDFQCPGCLQLARTIPRLAGQFKDTLQIIFKHFPLDSTCNSLVQKELHPKACQAARAGEAARVQGRFWAFHDALFAPRSERGLSLKSTVEQLGMDFQRFEKDSRSDEAMAKIQADIDLGIRLGVDGTPSLFINGRRAYDTRPHALQFLIAHEIEHAGNTADHASP